MDLSLTLAAGPVLLLITLCRNLSIMVHVKSDKESYSAANSIGRKVLYNSRGLDVISLLVKYYVPLAIINKVIKLLKFKSAMNLQCF